MEQSNYAIPINGNMTSSSVAGAIVVTNMDNKESNVKDQNNNNSTDTPHAVTSLNGPTNQIILSSGGVNPAMAIPSTGHTSLMPMPVAMPLPGLTTLPLALCAMNGAGNMGGAGIVQPGGNIMGQAGVQGGGIILLNVGANNNANLSTLSQLVTCGNQIPAASPTQVKPMIIGSNTVGVQSPLQIQQQCPSPQVQAQQAPISFPQVMAANSHVPVQAPVVQQGGQPTAYMLVPIHQVPTIANQVPPQHQAGINQTSPLPQHIISHGNAHSPGVYNSLASGTPNEQNTVPHMAQVVAAVHAENGAQSQSIQQTLIKPFANPQFASLPCDYHTSSSSHQAYSTPSPVVVSTSPIPPQVSSMTNVDRNAAVWQNNTSPIHDPHISSSVQPPSKDTPPPHLNPALLNEFHKLYGQGHANQLIQESRSLSSGMELVNVLRTLSNASATPPTPSTPALAQSPLNERMDRLPSVESDCQSVSTPLTELTKIHTISSDVTSTRSNIHCPAAGGITTPSPSAQTWGHDPTEGAVPNLEPPRPVQKRKKGPAPKLDGNEVCLICGDKASGYHYGVLSCEGCKGFFRRSIIRGPTYKCKSDGKCQMDTYMRRKCQFCRLNKCRSAGMKDESVLSEVNSGSKTKRIKKEGSGFVASSMHFAPNLSFNGEPVPSLTSQQRNLVEMLQANETRYQWPTQEDVAKVTPWVETGDSHRSRASRFAHFTELAILIVQLVVEFTKQLPGFLTVSREDQILLLKACTIEVMFLRAAKQYDKKKEAFNFLNGKFYDKSSFYRAGMQVEFVDPIFDFCNSMAKLDLDEAEYALLVAINTFSSDRPNIKDLKKVEAVQDSYVELLRVYLKIHHPSEPLMFPKTLMKLVELRTLNNYHSEQIFALKVQDKQLPPLLAEIWDM